MAEARPPDAPRIIKQNSNKRYKLTEGSLEESTTDPPRRLTIEEEAAVARLAQLFGMRGLVGGVLRLLLEITKASGAAGATAVHADRGDYRLLLIAAIAEVRSKKAKTQ